MRGRVQRSPTEKLWFWFRIRWIRLRRFWRSRVLDVLSDWQDDVLRNRLVRRSRRIGRWWQRQNRRYGIWWRLGNGAVAVLLLVSIVIPVVQQLMLSDSYELSADTLRLVGTADPALAKQLTYNASQQTYQFNNSAIKPADGSNPLASMEAQVGTASGNKNDKSLYALDVPTDFTKGVTYSDINSGLSFSLIPQFAASPGKNVDNHLVFPLASDRQAIYTLKNNGLKEDIVVQHPEQDTMAFSYHLDLPKTLEAKVIPNSGGNIGIYSADPSLFGNISYGSSKDRAAVEKAREKAAKTYLVFGLPSPVIKNTAGKEIGSARFELNGSHLAVVATGLSGQSDPVTIDPSVVVTSTSDFQSAGNDEDNIDFSTSGQITRGGLTGGSISAGWTTNTDTGITPAGDYGQGVAAYNGYIYVVDGFASSSGPYAIYAQINSDGSLGAWATATLPNTGRNYPGLVAYNDYLYMYGGYDRTNGLVSNTVESVPIHSDGSLGSAWTTSANTMTYGVCRFGATVYEGYLYAVGGANIASTGCPGGSTATQYVQYAPLNADGTVGPWVSSANQFTTARFADNATAYNGYLYVAGGANTGYSTKYSDVQYAKLGSDGSVGTWMTTSAMSRTRSDGVVTAYDGYMYAFSGITNSGGGQGSNDVMYAQINANGTLGSWVATSTFTNARFEGGGFAYNGYLYLNDGYNSGTSTIYNDTQYAKIDPGAITQPWTTDTTHTLNAARSLVCSAAYGGYLYSIGGSTHDDTTYNVSTVQYAAISASGTIGSWSTATALPQARGSAGCVAFNGYLYVVGGFSATGSTTNSSTNTSYYVSINSNGSLGSPWNTGATLPTASAGNTVLTYSANGNNYIYSLGGDGSGGTGNGVYYAILNASTGAVGSWTQSSNSVPGTAGLQAFSLVGSIIYNISTSSGTKAYYSTITSSGDLSAWTSLTAPGSTLISYTDISATNGCLYVLGAKTNTGSSVGTVKFACPNSDGSVTSWLSAPSLVTGTKDMGVTTYNGVIYGVGGYTTAVTNTTMYAAVNNGGNGTAGTWTTNTDTGSVYPLTTYAAAVAYNGYFYIIGGDATTAKGTQVYYAPLNGDGSLGAWAATTSMNVPRMYPNVAAYNGYLYAFAGYNVGNSTANNTVEYAHINSDGSVGGWTTSSNVMPTAVCRSAYATYNGYLYVLGGASTPSSNCGNSSTVLTSQVQYAHINSDGSVGSWGTTNGFTYATGVYSKDGVLSPASVAYNGYLYIMGGTPDGGNMYAAVQYAPIQSDGTVGTWVTTMSMPTGNNRYGVVAYDGYLYVSVNSGSLASTSTVFTNLNADGSLGAWNSTNSFTTGRYSQAVAVYNGYMYISGGSKADGSGSLDDTQYAPLNSIARTAHYSKLIDLGSAANVTGVNYNGLVPDGQAAVTYRAAGSNGVFGATASVSNISGSGCTGNLLGKRYMFVMVTLDDSYGGGSGGAFPDAAGTNANLTDLTVNYSAGHPQPQIRLRGGQTLQQGNLSALDTCYP